MMCEDKSCIYVGFNVYQLLVKIRILFVEKSYPTIHPTKPMNGISVRLIEIVVIDTHLIKEYNIFRRELITDNGFTQIRH
jgi:hypothetical protein